MRLAQTLLWLPLWSAFAFAAGATPVTYTATAYADGFFDGAAFTDQLMALTGLADTSGLTITSPFPPLILYTNPLSRVTVSVSGVGTDVLVHPGVVFDFGFAAGFNPSPNPLDIPSHDLLDVDNAAFLDYDLAMSIGPIIGSNGAAGSLGMSFATEAGSITVTAFDSNGSFQTTIPEPRSLSLMLLGIVFAALAKVVVNRQFVKAHSSTGTEGTSEQATYRSA